jgi:hypothetical protein
VCRKCAAEYLGIFWNIQEILKNSERNRKEIEDAKARGT